jgi:hypothetical protein
MVRRSKTVVALDEIGDAVVAHCIGADAMAIAYSESESDSGSDGEMELPSKVLAAMYYFAASSFCYFLWGTYRPDIHSRRFCYGIPEWKKIVIGYKYNDKEFLKMFRVPHDCFNGLVRLLKHHAAFSKRGMK